MVSSSHNDKMTSTSLPPKTSMSMTLHVYMMIMVTLFVSSLPSSSSRDLRRSQSSYYPSIVFHHLPPAPLPVSEASIQLPPSPLPPQTSLPQLPSTTTSSISCDYDSYVDTGCEDDEGSVCDTSSQKCVCRPGYPIRLLAYCLPAREIGQDCFTSSQCRSVDNAACYIFGKEYDNERTLGGHNVGRVVTNWPTGTCRCNVGYVWDNKTSTCLKKTIGSWCNDDWDCIRGTFNTQCSRTSSDAKSGIGPSSVCECSWGFLYDPRTDSCQIPRLYGVKCLGDEECSPEGFVCSSPSTGMSGGGGITRCVCPTGTHYDHLRPGCKPNDDSSCDIGYRWDQEWLRCIPAGRSSSSVSTSSLPSLSNSSNPFNRSSSNSTSPTRRQPPSNASSEGSSLSVVLMLTLPNLLAIGIILRYCYYRKMEEESGDDLRNTHIHNFSKFCAYPTPYSMMMMRPPSLGPFGPCCGPPKLSNEVIGVNGNKLTVLESVAEESASKVESSVDDGETMTAGDKEGQVAEGAKGTEGGKKGDAQKESTDQPSTSAHKVTIEEAPSEDSADKGKPEDRQSPSKGQEEVNDMPPPPSPPEEEVKGKCNHDSPV